MQNKSKVIGISEMSDETPTTDFGGAHPPRARISPLALHNKVANSENR
jgi:hypothetical protein